MQIEFLYSFSSSIPPARGFFCLNGDRLVDLQLFFLFEHGKEEGERQERGWVWALALFGDI